MPKAIIVDDDPLNLRVLSAMLQMSGYEVFATNTGRDAVKLLQEVQADIVMIDLLMPRSTMDGADTAQALRNLPHLSNVPVIAVSAADTQTIQNLIQEGLFDAYLQKPITTDKLNTLLRRLTNFGVA